MNNDITYQEALNWSSSCLEGQKVDQNAPMFIMTMMNNWSTTDWLMHRHQKMPVTQWHFYQNATTRVLQHEPAQYIVGRAPFYGRIFAVNSDVLVPESETEELVEWVLATVPKERSLKVLDLGTGSGVIGVTLKLERPDWQVTMSDISERALSVADQNAHQLGASVKLIRSDVFDQISVADRFDLIVTNPPYIAEDERSMMDEAVLKYEPKIALFAQREGLAIYDRIAAQLDQRLEVNGQLFGETGFSQEQSIQKLFAQRLPFARVETKHDINDVMRMVRVRLTSEKWSDHDEN